MAQDPALTQEAEVFERNLDEWRQTHLGQFVLIKGTDVIGFYESLEKAFKTGTEQFGLRPFFVKQIVPRDVVNVSMSGRRILAAS